MFMDEVRALQSLQTQPGTHLQCCSAAVPVLQCPVSTVLLQEAGARDLMRGSSSSGSGRRTPRTPSYSENQQ